MEKKKVKVLLVNDDGIHAPGLYHLWRALESQVDLYIVAPAAEKSGVGMALTLHKPITIHSVPWEKGTPAWKVSGNPADCVRFGLRFLLDTAPDLIVSGINRGSNAGRNVLYSGTVGGVIEGALRGIPGIAFSSSDYESPCFSDLESHVFPIVEHLLEHPMKPGTVLNVNFPTPRKVFKGIRLARQGKGLFREDPTEREHPYSGSYFWHGGKWADHEEPEESDVALLNQGFITAVPLHVEELTDHTHLSERRELFNSHFAAKYRGVKANELFDRAGDIIDHSQSS